MPGGDGTGPVGMGPMTGRGMGYCAGFMRPGFANTGSGMRRGRGFRRTFRIFGSARRRRLFTRGAGRMRWY